VLTGLRAATAARAAPEVRVELVGALHRDVTLIPALSPLAAALGLEGDTPGAITRAATTARSRALLDHHLPGLGPDPALTPPEVPTARPTLSAAA
jgi:hypothetical protein